MRDDFNLELHQLLLSNYKNNYSDNSDPVLPEAVPTPFFANLKPLEKFLYRIFPNTILRRQSSHTTSGRFLYDHLQNDSSRQILLQLLAFRTLGHRKVKLSRNTLAFWQTIEKLKRSPFQGQAQRVGPFELIPIDLNPFGIDMQMLTTATGAAAIFFQKQYEYHAENICIRAEAGDTVIDGGGGWGDTALYFSKCVGEKGRVLSFEMIPENLRVFEDNLQRNTSYAKTIEIIKKPLWSTAGKRIFLKNRGPSSRVEWEPKDSLESCETSSIDQIVLEKNLPRVDFIKMDIEGAELAALKGAERTLKRYQPKLAISIYHKREDFDVIPEYLNSLDVGYEFFLDHHTIYLAETVLYARPRRLLQ